MDDLRALRQAIDRIFAGELDPLLDLLADDVNLQVALGAESGLCRRDEGKEAVAGYFCLLEGMVPFWQLDYTVRGDQLIAWGRESYTVEPWGLEVSNEFAMVFDLDHDRIRRVLVLEDLPSFFREGRPIDSGSKEFPPLTVFDMVEHLAVSEVSPAASAVPVPT